MILIFVCFFVCLIGTRNQAAGTYSVQVNKEQQKERDAFKARMKNRSVKDMIHGDKDHGEKKKKKKNIAPVVPIYAFELQTTEQEWWKTSEMVKEDNDDTKTITLMILDPQNDFHFGQGVEGDKDYRPNGSLAVPGNFYI